MGVIDSNLQAMLTQEAQEAQEELIDDYKLKLSLMKRQLQMDYILKIKNTIQHLILKDPNFSDKDRLYRIQQSKIEAQRRAKQKLRQKPSADTIDAQIKKATKNEENNQDGDNVGTEDDTIVVPPLWDTPKMREILKQYVPLGDIILDDDFFQTRIMRDFRPSMDMEEFYDNCNRLVNLINGQHKNRQMKVVLPELIQIYKIPKLMQMLQLEGQDSKYSDTYQQVKDFANFLAHKSLNSELYLSVNMLYQT